MNKKQRRLLLVLFAVSQAAAQVSDPNAGMALVGIFLIIAIIIAAAGFVALTTSIEWIGAMISLYKQRKKEMISKKEVAATMFLLTMVASVIGELLVIGYLVTRTPPGGSDPNYILLLLCFFGCSILYAVAVLWSIAIDMAILWLVEKYLSKQVKNRYIQYTIAIFLLPTLFAAVALIGLAATWLHLI